MADQIRKNQKDIKKEVPYVQVDDLQLSINRILRLKLNC